MILDNEHRALFFKLYMPLLVWVNNRKKIVEGFETGMHPVRIDSSLAIQVRTEMYGNPEWIDEYLASGWADELTGDERGIVSAWRRFFIKDRFYVMRHHVKHSVLMSSGGEARLYGAVGLSSSFEDIYDASELPALVEAVLLPFKGIIVFDGMLNVYSVEFGPHYRSELNDEYRESKEKYGVIESLPFTGAPAKGKKSAPSRKPAAASPVREKADEISKIVSDFCNENLDGEHLKACLKALDKLRRKRVSPLNSGRANTWACGIVYAVASNNFVFDRDNELFMSADDIAGWFGLAKSTAQNKAAQVKGILGMSGFPNEYTTERVRAGLFRHPGSNYEKMNEILKLLRRLR